MKKLSPVCSIQHKLRCCSPFGIPVVRGEVGHGYRRLCLLFFPHLFHDDENYGTSHGSRHFSTTSDTTPEDDSSQTGR